MHIYLVTHVASGRNYVGKTNNFARRVNEHCSRSRTRTTYFHTAVLKYGRDAFAWRVVGSFDNEDDALTAEVMLIAKLQSDVKGLGFNLESGGRGGKSLSLETKAKIRAANLGKKASVVAKRAMSMARRGKKMPPRSKEWRRKISEAAKARLAVNHPMTGKRHSEETKAKLRGKRRLLGPMSDAHKEKISAAQRGRPATGKRRESMLARASARRGTVCDEAVREKCRAASKAKWADPEYRAKVLAARARRKEGV